jgi:membrane protein involved in colicin uptake
VVLAVIFGSMGGNGSEDKTVTTGSDTTATVNPSQSSQATAAPTVSKAEADKQAKAEAARQAEAAKQAAAAKKAEAARTAAQENAVGAAEDYLSFTAFSRNGLIEQLSSDAGDGYSVKDATYAVDSLNTNYNEQATKAAKKYLSFTHFSHAGLVEQLESDAGDGYTHEQAEYGVSHAGL